MFRVGHRLLVVPLHHAIQGANTAANIVVKCSRDPPILQGTFEPIPVNNPTNANTVNDPFPFHQIFKDMYEIFMTRKNRLGYVKLL